MAPLRMITTPGAGVPRPASSSPWSSRRHWAMAANAASVGSAMCPKQVLARSCARIAGGSQAGRAVGLAAWLIA
ncbi:Uncharacterised protein [Bordetella pertussis]|nr:Uncharacterised protein [Bordetella pertussis]